MREVMLAVVERGKGGLPEVQIGFVQQHARIEERVVVARRQPLARNAAEVIVEEREEPVDRAGVVPPLAVEQGCDVAFVRDRKLPVVCSDISDAPTAPPR
jgi:hypothetical protein